MTFISYAQNFEDVMLWRALRHIQNGCYIDIGANDPIVDSVSLAFYEHGWRGVHLEPTAQYANLLRQQRPDELVIQAAVSDSQKLLTFFEFPDTGLSTLDATIAAEHQQKGFRVLQTVTPTLTLDDVFAQNLRTDIHWLKIDVEGFEEAVLRGWNTSEIRPWIVVVESTLPMSTTPSHQHWEALVLQKGYQFVYFDGLNRYYVSDLHPELMAEPWNPPNVFDGFTIDGRASNVFSQDIQRRLQAAMQSGQQSAATELQASEQAKQTLLNQLVEVRSKLEQQATSAREEHQTLNRQLKDARDELGQMVRLVSQREQEFSQRFADFQSDHEIVNRLWQKEREQTAQQLEGLQQQLQVQQQQYQAELQRYRELDQRLTDIQQQLRQKEQVFARQLLQLHQQKSGQQKVFQIREQSLRTELKRAKEEIQSIGQQYQAELDALQLSNEAIRAESARWQNQYLQLQQESVQQLAKLAAELKLSESSATQRLQQSVEQYQAQLLRLEEQHKALLQQREEQYQMQLQQLLKHHDDLLQQKAELFDQLQKSYEEQKGQLEEQSNKYQLLLQQSYSQQRELESEAAQHNAEINLLIEEINSTRLFIIQQQQDIAQLSTEIYDQKILYGQKIEDSIVHFNTAIKDIKNANEIELLKIETRHEQELDVLTESLIKNFETKINAKSQSLHEAYGEKLALADNSNKLLDIMLKDAREKKLALASQCAEHAQNLETARSESQILVDELRKAYEVIDFRNKKIDSINSELEYVIEQNNLISSTFEDFTKTAVNNLALIRQELSSLSFDSDFISNRDISARIDSLVYYVSANYKSSEHFAIESTQMINSEEVVRVRHVSELLNFEGELFVESTFLNILERRPDVLGLSYYVSQIYAGKSKVNIIYQVAMSEEGRAKINKIEGLETLIDKCKRANIPLIGRVLQPKIYRDMSPQYDYIRSSLARLTSIEDRFTGQIDQISKKVSSLEGLTSEIYMKVCSLAGNNKANEYFSEQPQSVPDTPEEEQSVDKTSLTKIGSALFNRIVGVKN
jgi:FkbM family methyltransferase